MGWKKVDVDLSDKLLWLVLIAGVASMVVIGVIKFGHVMVRRRTDALLAAHRRDEEEDEGTPREG